MGKIIFECKKCGKCCEGRGGAVLAPRDLTRLADFMRLAEAEFLNLYAETIAGKPKIRTGPTGFCIFFQPDIGCKVHEAKPDVCRAWPFFRGNLADRISFEMARADCPGIDKTCGHDEFTVFGLATLLTQGLLAADTPTAPNALKAASLICTGDQNGQTRTPD